MMTRAETEAMCQTVQLAWNTTLTVRAIAKAAGVGEHRARAWIQRYVPGRREFLAQRDDQRRCDLCGCLLDDGKRCDDCQHLYGDAPWAIVWYRAMRDRENSA